MRNMIISLIVLIISFCVIANTTISINPFKIRMETPLLGTGLALIAIGITLIISEAKITERKRVLKEIQEELQKTINSKF